MDDRLKKSGTLATTPWASLSADFAKRKATGSIELDDASFITIVKFRGGAPVELRSGELVADEIAPEASLKERLAALAKLPGTTKYVVSETESAPKIPVKKISVRKAEVPKPEPKVAPTKPIVATVTSDDSVDIAVTVPPPVAQIAAAAGEIDVLVSEKPPALGPEIRVDADGLDAQSHYERAYKLLSNGAQNDADAALQKAFAVDPHHPDACALAIWLELQRIEDPKEAVLLELVTRLDAIIARAPRSERAFYYRGTIYKKLGKTAKATSDLEMAVELNPRSVSLARGLQLATKTAEEAEPAKAETVEYQSVVAPSKPSSSSRTRVALLAFFVVALGAVAVYVMLPPRLARERPPDFSWVPNEGPKAP
jgi:tetratricopeptide (TPR) repeat protein